MSRYQLSPEDLEQRQAARMESRNRIRISNAMRAAYLADLAHEGKAWPLSGAMWVQEQTERAAERAAHEDDAERVRRDVTRVLLKAVGDAKRKVQATEDDAVDSSGVRQTEDVIRSSAAGASTAAAAEHPSGGTGYRSAPARAHASSSQQPASSSSDPVGSQVEAEVLRQTKEHAAQRAAEAQRLANDQALAEARKRRFQGATVTTTRLGDAVRDDGDERTDQVVYEQITTPDRFVPPQTRPPTRASKNTGIGGGGGGGGHGSSSSALSASTVAAVPPPVTARSAPPQNPPDIPLETVENLVQELADQRQRAAQMQRDFVDFRAHALSTINGLQSHLTTNMREEQDREARRVAAMRVEGQPAVLLGAERGQAHWSAKVDFQQALGGYRDQRPVLDPSAAPYPVPASVVDHMKAAQRPSDPTSKYPMTPVPAWGGGEEEMDLEAPRPRSGIPGPSARDGGPSALPVPVALTSRSAVPAVSSDAVPTAGGASSRPVQFGAPPPPVPGPAPTYMDPIPVASAAPSSRAPAPPTWARKEWWGFGGEVDGVVPYSETLVPGVIPPPATRPHLTRADMAAPDLAPRTQLDLITAQASRETLRREVDALVDRYKGSVRGLANPGGDPDVYLVGGASRSHVTDAMGDGTGRGRRGGGKGAMAPHVTRRTPVDWDLDVGASMSLQVHARAPARWRR